MEPRNHKPGGIRNPADAVERRRRESAAVTAQNKDAALRTKRLRREPSAGKLGLSREPSNTSLGALAAGGEEEGYVALQTPEDISDLVQQAVTATKGAANPVGCRAHLDAVRALRQLLSNYEDPPYQAALSAGAIPALISALQPPRMDATALETIFEAAWALTNLAVGQADVVEAVVPAAPILIAYLGGGSGTAVSEQCAWALGNIAAEDAKYREVLIANGAVRPLTKLLISAAETLTTTDAQNLQNDNNPAIAAGTTAAWALSNLLRGANPAEIGELMGTPNGPEAIIKLLDVEVSPVHTVGEVAWVLAHICAAPSEVYLNRLVHLGVVMPLAQQIIAAVEDNDNTVLMPTLRSLGNILGGGGRDAISQILNPDTELNLTTNTMQEDVEEQQGGAQKNKKNNDGENVVLLAVVAAAQSSHHGVQREAAWVLSNVAGLQGREGVDALNAAGAVPVLMSLLKDQPFHVRKEAAYALANICAGGGGGSGDSETLNELFGADKDAVRAMLSLLRSADVDAARLGLQFTEMLCRNLPSGVKEVEESDGIDALEKLQFGEAPSELQEAAAALVNHYWSIEAE